MDTDEGRRGAQTPENGRFPSLVDLADEKSSFGEYMKTAECKINKASLLIEACNLIDRMQISQQNQDVQGDLYEYLLNKLSAAGRAMDNSARCGTLSA